MGIELYDHYEEDGQLSLFGTQEQAQEPAGQEEAKGGTEVRIRSCSSCGKLLSVREEEHAFLAECSNCGIRYCQKR